MICIENNDEMLCVFYHYYLLILQALVEMICRR